MLAWLGQDELIDVAMATTVTQTFHINEFAKPRYKHKDSS